MDTSDEPYKGGFRSIVLLQYCLKKNLFLFVCISNLDLEIQLRKLLVFCLLIYQIYNNDIF
jgi:hypothetical protein